MDRCKIFLVSILQVLHIVVFHILWYDGRGHDPKPPHRFHRLFGILCPMEPIFRFRRAKDCKFYSNLLIFMFMLILCST